MRPTILTAQAREPARLGRTTVQILRNVVAVATGVWGGVDEVQLKCVGIEWTR